MEQSSELDKIGDNGLTRRRCDPEHRLVLILITVGILYRHLGFADASQAINRLCLCQGSSALHSEFLFEEFKQFLATGEQRITTVRNTQDFGRLRFLIGK